MTINDPYEFVTNLWDWGFLDDCFENGIRVTDVDGLVERRGNFLVIETKAPGVSVPEGQRILFDQLTRSPRFNVLILWGRPNAPELMQLWNYTDPEPTNVVDVKARVARWYRWANENPR